MAGSKRRCTFRFQDYASVSCPKIGRLEGSLGALNVKYESAEVSRAKEEYEVS